MFAIHSKVTTKLWAGPLIRVPDRQTDTETEWQNENRGTNDTLKV